MKDLTPLGRAIEEEKQRRIKSIEELKELSSIVIRAIEESSFKPSDIRFIKESTIDGLRFDIDIMNSLMDHLNEFYAEEMAKLHALRTNKVVMICEGAIDLIEFVGIDKLISYNIQEYLKLDSENPTYFYDSENDFGTGKPTFVAVALLKILAIVKGTPEGRFLNFKDLEPVLGDIYNINISPLMQTVKFPDGFEPSNIEGLENWFFYYLYADNNIGELLVPTGGFYFGGTDNDRFLDKVFKPEDCFSAVGKWFNFPPELFSLIREKAPRGNYEDEKELLQLALLYNLYPQNEVGVGYIYLIKHSEGMHTGIVAEVSYGVGFMGLSYNRALPERDGLAYQEHPWNAPEGKKYYFFKYVLELEENLEIGI